MAAEESESRSRCCGGKQDFLFCRGLCLSPSAGCDKSACANEASSRPRVTGRLDTASDRAAGDDSLNEELLNHALLFTPGFYSSWSFWNVPAQAAPI